MKFLLVMGTMFSTQISFNSQNPHDMYYPFSYFRDGKAEIREIKLLVQEVDCQQYVGRSSLETQMI